MVSGAAQGPLVGQVLSGKYRILAKLGEGAMAGVYLAEHQGVGATIVLKVLLPALAEEPEVVESFLREARIAAEIHHDNVIDIFYSGRSPEGFVFLAMEYVKGSTLFDVLQKEGPMAWPRAQPLLVEIAGALAAAHAIGVVHRDVKPENVLVGHKGKGADAVEYVKVVDFGIANAARGDIGGAESVCGTPQFMPPEQAQGQPPDARDDVYAFGCLMYQVLTSEVPFQAEDVPKLLLMHLREPVQPPRQRRPDLEIPEGAEAIIMRALEKKRADRYQDMAEVQRELSAVKVPLPKVDVPAPAAKPKPPLATGGGPNLRSRIAREEQRRSKLPLLLVALIVGGVVATGLGRQALKHAPGRIEIETEPLEAEIWVDGQKMADRSPMFLDASPGSYTVVVRSPGYAPQQRVLEMRPRAQDVAAFVLTPLSPPQEAAARPATPRARPSAVASGGAAAAAHKRPPAASTIDGVTFIDFKKASAGQH
jgi:serine/threonine protein kinase